MFCPECKAEYLAEVSVCSDCNVKLVDRLPDDSPHNLRRDEELVVVRTYGSELEADVAKTALEGSGIEAMLRSDDGGGESPSMQISRGIQIVVKSGDAADANAVLDLDVSEETKDEGE